MFPCEFIDKRMSCGWDKTEQSSRARYIGIIMSTVDMNIKCNEKRIFFYLTKFIIIAAFG